MEENNNLENKIKEISMVKVKENYEEQLAQYTINTSSSVPFTNFIDYCDMLKNNGYRIIK